MTITKIMAEDYIDDIDIEDDEGQRLYEQLRVVVDMGK